MSTRAKYCLTGYLAGYVISLFETGIPKIYYLIPLKFASIALALGCYLIYEVRAKKIDYFHDPKGFSFVWIWAWIITAILVALLFGAMFIQKHFGIDLNWFLFGRD